MCLGLMKWFTSLFSEGIISASGENGVGWPPLLVCSTMKYFFVCLFPFFPPYLESADSLFVLICIAGYLHCAIVEEKKKLYHNELFL